MILKRLAGMTLKELADEFGVPKQVDQNHEWKEITQELKMIVLRRAAEVADLILAVADNGGYRCNSKNGDSPLGKNGNRADRRYLGLMRSKGQFADS